MTSDLPPAIRDFDAAQRRTWTMVGDVWRRLEAGMSERDIFELAETRLEANAFSTWYHLPEISIRRGGGLRWPLPSARRKLAVGDLITIDLGPGEGESYGDAGFTCQFGTNIEPPVLRVARECTRACCGYTSRWKTLGEIFIFAQAWAINDRMSLGNTRSVGHRILVREGWVQTGFPRSAHLATLLARNRLHRLNPVRMDGIFALRPVVTDSSGTASFEEMVYVHEDTHVVLGRNGLAEVGTLPA